MKFREYLADHISIILIFLFVIILSECLFLIFNITFELNVFILAIDIAGFLFSFIFSYFKEAIFLRELQKRTELLDQKFLIHELLPTPETHKEQILCQVISDINRSMIDQINQYKYNFRDFKEYLELWVHEIKLPIASLRLILEHERKNQESILQLDRLDSYVNQILYFARSEHVEKDYQISECSLANIVKHVALKNQDIILNSQIKFQVENLDKIVETDPKWLEFILDQLLANCIKYRKIKHPEIKIYTEEKDKFLALHVYDNGIGIPLSDQSRIFQKAFTGQNGRILEQDQKKAKLLAETKYLKSTGMGLYIVKKLIKKLGHQISVSSTENEYTDIVIYFAKNDYYKNVRNRNIQNTTKP